MLPTDTTDLNKIGDLFLSIIKSNLSGEAFTWLNEKADLVRSEDQSIQLNLTFSQLPRKTGKAFLNVNEAELSTLNILTQGFSLEEWTIDRLSRVWLLMQVSATDKDNYLRKVKALFANAEMNELAALYAALPFYAYPEQWISVCENGIRSNIGIVLEAIMYANPYPAKYLSEGAFNQLVLKAFFTEKDVTKITGLTQRMNQALADTLNDYIDERTAAHREVEPNIYKLIELRNQI